MCDLFLSWDTLGKVISSGLTLFFAGIVAYVAFQQWKINRRLAEVAEEQFKINRRQYRLALFEKRYAVFSALAAHCAAVVYAMASPLEDNKQFLRDTKDSDFLFGPEVHGFIEEIWKQGNRLMTLQAVTPRQPEKETAIVDWFQQQISEARNMFFKYIDFTEDF